MADFPMNILFLITFLSHSLKGLTKDGSVNKSEGEKKAALKHETLSKLHLPWEY